MLGFRVVCVLWLVVAIRGDITFDQNNIDLFGGDSETFENQIKRSLEKTKNFFASDTVATATDVAGNVLSFVPFVSEFSGLLPTLRSVLSAETDVEENLAKAIPDATQRRIAKNDMRKMRAKLTTISENVGFLRSERDFDSKSRTAIVHDIHTALDTIVNTLIDPESIFRQYPLVAVNILFPIASSLSVFFPIQKTIVPGLGKKSKTACKLKRALFEYRTLAAENRMYKLDQNINLHPHAELRHTIVRQVMNKPYSENGYNRHSRTLECDRDCSEFRYCLTDKVSNQRFDTGATDDMNDCILSYMGFIRYGIEKAFEDPLDLMIDTCDKSKALRRSKRSKKSRFDPQEETTGYGWWEFTLLESRGNVVVDDRRGIACDTTGACDPYIRVLVDGREVHKTEPKSNEINPKWDETYRSRRMRKDARITIEIWDDDSGFLGSADDLMLRWETSIDELLKDGTKYYETMPFEKDDYLATKSSWRDEYSDDD